MNSQFENIDEVKVALKKIIEEHGVELFRDSKRFTGLLNDYMPDLEKERRLIKNVINNNVITQMLDEPDQKLSVVKAREYMLNDMFLSAIATEFVLDCFTHMFGWPFTPEIKQEQVAPAPVQTPAASGNGNASDKEIKQKPFRPIDAWRYKILPNVKIAEGYTSVSDLTFDGYGMIKTVKLPSTCQAIGKYAFSECKKLRTVSLPESLRAIGSGAFISCSSLERVEIPWGVTAIEEDTFAFCINLEDIIIPSSVSSIGDAAFQGCETLRDVMLPDTIKYISDTAFAMCPAITIQCRENSYVHKFCMTNGIHFEFIRNK